MDQLLSAVGARPGDLDSRRVLGDALLAGADPRGELMVAQLAGLPVPRGPDSAWARCVETVRRAVPAVDVFRVEAGLVTDLHLGAGDQIEVDPEWLAREPLLFPWVRLPGDSKQPIEPLLRLVEDSLWSCQGVGLEGRVDAGRWPPVHAFLDELQPRRLALTLDLGGDALDPLPHWPKVERAELSATDATTLRLLLATALPSLKRLRLTGDDLDQAVLAALALDGLEHIDLRGCPLAPATHDALTAWLAGAPGRSVRHERVSLAAPDLDDPFGDRGLRWEAASALNCRVAAVPDAAMSFACARGPTLQFHLRDAPQWRRQAEAPITALAAQADALVLGREDGVVETWSLAGEALQTIVTLPGPIRQLRSLAIPGRDAELAAVYDGGWWSSRGEGGDEALVDLWLTAHGSVRAEGSRLIIREGADERSVDFGEPIYALAVPDESARAPILAAGRQIWRLDDEGPTLLDTRRGGRAVVAASTERLAWITSRTTAMTCHRGTLTAVTYTNRYSDSSNDELALADLCVLDGDVVVTGLEHGGMNLLLRERAMKADEFPGEAKRKWIFFYLGSILIAE